LSEYHVFKSRIYQVRSTLIEEIDNAYVREDKVTEYYLSEVLLCLQKYINAEQSFFWKHHISLPECQDDFEITLDSLKKYLNELADALGIFRSYSNISEVMSTSIEELQDIISKRLHTLVAAEQKKSRTKQKYYNIPLHVHQHIVQLEKDMQNNTIPDQIIFKSFLIVWSYYVYLENKLKPGVTHQPREYKKIHRYIEHLIKQKNFFDVLSIKDRELDVDAVKKYLKLRHMDLADKVQHQNKPTFWMDLFEHFLSKNDILSKLKQMFR
jgi:hypothetical protein